MTKYSLILICLFFCTMTFAGDADSLLDNNTAFYEGKTYSYIIAPPDDYKMNSVESTDDGYSFAFIPTNENYDSASIIIGINIFKIKSSKKNPFSLEMLINDDTTAIRTHYGKDITISEVEPIVTSTTDKLRTIYLNSKDNILPNVMISYLDGISEILIFELSISDSVTRFKAEAIYLNCLEQIKVLTKGKIDVG